MLVEILDFNFNSYTNGEFWYELDVTVFDENRDQLASSNFKDNAVIDGSAWTGAKGAMEEWIPQLYALMLKAIVRDNDEVMNALLLAASER